MSDEPPSGSDLARQALAQWKASAKNAGATKATKGRKKRKAQYGDGRDPVGLGSVITALGEERDWKTASAGGSLTDQWAELCPELVGKVAPTNFDAATGRLDLRPASPTYAAHLRMLGPQLVTRLQVKGAPVRTIRVLAPGTLTAAGVPQPVDEPIAPLVAPIVTRDAASPGYRAALEAHLAAAGTRTDTEVQQRTRAAAEQQTAAMRAHREPESSHAEAEWFADNLEAQARAERDRLILKLARDHKAGRGPEVHTVFQRTA